METFVNADKATIIIGRTNRRKKTKNRANYRVEWRECKVKRVVEREVGLAKGILKVKPLFGSIL